MSVIIEDSADIFVTDIRNIFTESFFRITTSGYNIFRDYKSQTKYIIYRSNNVGVIQNY